MKLSISIIFMFLAVFMYGQQNITGKITDENGFPLINVNVIEKGTSNGTVTDFDGNFTITTTTKIGELELTYLGYENMTIIFNTTTANIGTIELKESTNSLNEVVIYGVADIAKERETPVAVSTIKAKEIQQQIGNRELPELLNRTPSVYATKSGGGFGDARINVRGFDQVNTAVLINGVPVNDMENGRVFWSNWAGLADVSSAIQVQRGLGASKLAIASVGGTINILTKTTERREGGFVSSTFGNNNFLKTVASYSTGKSEKGLAFTALFGRTETDGYVKGTYAEAYNYYLAGGWSSQDNTHNLQVTFTGAPQVHGQRTTSFFNMATLDNYLQYGKRYNFNYGTLDGQDFNWRENFYHKPIASINWDWKINDRSKLSSVVYASWGRGGGTGDRGRLPGFLFPSNSIFRDQNSGEVLFDRIRDYNSGQAVIFSDGNVYQRTDADANGLYFNQSSNAGLTKRASINSHNWYGGLFNYENEINENFEVSGGLDLRTYKGYHYRRLDNLLGADGYIANGDVNNPGNVLLPRDVIRSDFNSIVNVFKSIDDEAKINYYNIGYVNWFGLFGQAEYKNEKISAFFQASASSQGFRREDLFQYTPQDSDPGQESDTEIIFGGNFKGGLNYNINEKNNVFFNAGYYSKQPLFDAIFLNFGNVVNDEYENEKVLSFEAGYGLKLDKFKANVNVYRTSWKDRFLTISTDFDVNGTDVPATANISGLEQVHMGIEIESEFEISPTLTLTGMLSVNNWEYNGNPSASYFDDNQALVASGNFVNLDGQKVGDAAQSTFRLGAVAEISRDLFFDASWSGFSSLYSTSFNDTDVDGNGNISVEPAISLPSYQLFDAGLSYKVNFEQAKKSLSFRFNVNNLLNEEYIAESRTSIAADSDPANNYRGINRSNKVFFGFGRTWNASIRLDF